MSEIEKMMQNAGIKSLPTCKNCDMLDEYWSNGTYCSTCKCDKDNDECNIANYIYPPFTAEKQLELIKFLFNKGFYYSTFPNDTYQFHISDDIENPQPRKFDIAIAEIINDLWQDLTEEEKQQIKEILE